MKHENQSELGSELCEASVTGWLAAPGPCFADESGGTTAAESGKGTNEQEPGRRVARDYCLPFTTSKALQPLDLPKVHCGLRVRSHGSWISLQRMAVGQQIRSRIPIGKHRPRSGPSARHRSRAPVLTQ
jgi:hypothetical protein